MKMTIKSSQVTSEVVVTLEYQQQRQAALDGEMRGVEQNTLGKEKEVGWMHVMSKQDCQGQARYL